MKMRSVVFSVVILFAACSPKSGATDNEKSARKSLTQPLWQLSALPGMMLPAGTEVLLKFDNDRAYGQTGCNRFNGNYTLINNGLRFGAVATTRMMCPPDQMNIEKILLKALNDCDGYSVADKKLELRQGQTVLATFEVAPEKKK